MAEALGGVSYLHLSSETGESLVVETRDESAVRQGDRVGLQVDAAQAMAFDS